jgi:hypothetical protein
VSPCCRKRKCPDLHLTSRSTHARHTMMSCLRYSKRVRGVLVRAGRPCLLPLPPVSRNQARARPSRIMVLRGSQLASPSSIAPHRRGRAVSRPCKAPDKATGPVRTCVRPPSPTSGRDEPPSATACLYLGIDARDAMVLGEGKPRLFVPVLRTSMP